MGLVSQWGSPHFYEYHCFNYQIFHEVEQLFFMATSKWESCKRNDFTSRVNPCLLNSKYAGYELSFLSLSCLQQFSNTGFINQNWLNLIQNRGFFLGIQTATNLNNPLHIAHSDIPNISQVCKNMEHNILLTGLRPCTHVYQSQTFSA